MPANDLSFRHPNYLVATYPRLVVVTMVRTAAQRPPFHPATYRICRRIYPVADCLRPPDVFLLCRTTDSLCYRGASLNPWATSGSRQRGALAHPGARATRHRRRLLLPPRSYRHVRVLLPHLVRLHAPRGLVQVHHVAAELALILWSNSHLLCGCAHTRVQLTTNSFVISWVIGLIYLHD